MPLGKCARQGHRHEALARRLGRGELRWHRQGARYLIWFAIGGFPIATLWSVCTATPCVVESQPPRMTS